MLAFGLGTVPLLWLAQTQFHWVRQKLSPLWLGRVRAGLALVTATVTAGGCVPRSGLRDRIRQRSFVSEMSTTTSTGATTPSSPSDATGAFASPGVEIPEQTDLPALWRTADRCPHAGDRFLLRRMQLRLSPRARAWARGLLSDQGRCDRARGRGRFSGA